MQVHGSFEEIPCPQFKGWLVVSKEMELRYFVAHGIYSRTYIYK